MNKLGFSLIVMIMLASLLGCSLHKDEERRSTLEKLYEKAFETQNRFKPSLLDQDPNEGETYFAVVSASTGHFQAEFRSRYPDGEGKGAKRQLAKLVELYGEIALYPLNAVNVFYIDGCGEKAPIRGDSLKARNPSALLRYINTQKARGIHNSLERQIGLGVSKG